MFVARAVPALVCATALIGPVWAQVRDAPATFSTRGYLGLLPGRTRNELTCGAPGFSPGFSCERTLPYIHAGYVMARNAPASGYGYGYPTTQVMGGAPEAITRPGRPRAPSDRSASAWPRRSS